MGSFDPGPPPDKSGWSPTTSTVGGGLIGLTAAQLIVALSNQYLAHPFSAELSSSITAFCVTCAGYFFKDGGRK